MRNIIIALSVAIACAAIFRPEAAESSDPAIYEAQKKAARTGV